MNFHWYQFTLIWGHGAYGDMAIISKPNDYAYDHSDATRYEFGVWYSIDDPNCLHFKEWQGVMY